MLSSYEKMRLSILHLSHRIHFPHLALATISWYKMEQVRLSKLLIGNAHKKRTLETNQGFQTSKLGLSKSTLLGFSNSTKLGFLDCTKLRIFKFHFNIHRQTLPTCDSRSIWCVYLYYLIMHSNLNSLCWSFNTQLLAFCIIFPPPSHIYAYTTFFIKRDINLQQTLGIGLQKE